MSDKNYISHYGESNFEVVAKEIQPPDGTYDDSLKFSKSSHFKVSFCIIKGGKEDAIDINNYCSFGHIYRCDIYAQGLYGMTIKGGSRNILVDRCVFHGKPKSGYDIDIGNWSDQSDEETHVEVVNAIRADGRPVRIRVLHGSVTVSGGNVKVVVYPKIIVQIFRFFRGLFK